MNFIVPELLPSNTIFQVSHNGQAIPYSSQQHLLRCTAKCPDGAQPSDLCCSRILSLRQRPVCPMLEEWQDSEILYTTPTRQEQKNNYAFLRTPASLLDQPSGHNLFNLLEVETTTLFGNPPPTFLFFLYCGRSYAYKQSPLGQSLFRRRSPALDNLHFLILETVIRKSTLSPHC